MSSPDAMITQPDLRPAGIAGAALTPPARRLLAVDATRGLAMMFVCLSHFCWSLEAQRPHLAELLENIAMIATPTFLLISGAMLGLLQVQRPGNPGALSARLFHRGLFLLVCGHLVIAFAASWSHRESYVSVVLSRIYITDAVGICLMLVPTGAAQLRRGQLLALGGGLYAATVIMVYLWHPAASGLILAKLILIGVEADHVTQMTPFASPLLPYMAMYLMGAAFGRFLAQASREAHSERRVAMMAVRLGLTLMLAALSARLVFWRLGLNDHSAAGVVLHELVSPLRKVPPGPAYIAFFTGEGLVCLGAFFFAGQSGLGERATRLFAVFGQSSFFVFILQFYIFGPMYRYAPSAGGAAWPLWYAVPMVCIWFAAYGWRVLRGNRLFDCSYRLFSRTITAA